MYEFFQFIADYANIARESQDILKTITLFRANAYSLRERITIFLADPPYHADPQGIASLQLIQQNLHEMIMTMEKEDMQPHQKTYRISEYD